MNRDVFEGKWKQLRGLVKENWGKLTDDELDQVEGRMDRLVGLLQQRYGYAREEAEQALERMVSLDKEPAGAKRGMMALLLSLILAPALLLASACQPPDAAITGKVKAKLAADTTVSAYEINVDTRNKVVTLTGNLNSQVEKDRALQLARETSGVVDVVDRLAVQTAAGGEGDAPEPSRTMGEVIDDAAITASVKARLLDSPEVKGLRIDVDTREGIVYLTGKVSTAHERDRAIQIARETEHVRDVQANLDVRS